MGVVGGEVWVLRACWLANFGAGGAGPRALFFLSPFGGIVFFWWRVGRLDMLEILMGSCHLEIYCRMDNLVNY